MRANLLKKTPFIAVAALVLAGCGVDATGGADAGTPAPAAADGGLAGKPGAKEPVADIPAPADVAAPPADAEKTATGLASKVLQPGTSEKRPEAQDTVKVHYTGWTTDGKMFDSSVKRGSPASFALKGVIPGWTEGLQLMKIGEKRRFWIPEELAYKGKPGKPQGMLVFDVELLEVKEGPKPIPPPPDVAEVPAAAQRAKSGLAWIVLTPGTGKEHPADEDSVNVNYTGWTTDGKMFDSSVARGRPQLLKVDRVIPGWAEGLKLMVEGEKRRFWVPEALAYKGQPGAPAGMLVFEVELVSITKGPKPIPAPADVSKPPKDAEKTKTGLVSKVQKKGTGKEHPTAQSMVEVHYTGWTSDGKMFDSSVARGSPATFPLGGVIPGWTEGVQLMVVGEKRRFWIPEELAYKGRPGPQGTLTFDVELLKILAPGEKPAPRPMPPPPPGGARTPPTGAPRPLAPPK